MHKLVLIRHGESEWNKENRFTGWKDVDLSEKGKAEAKAAGQLLKSEGFASTMERRADGAWAVSFWRD